MSSSLKGIRGGHRRTITRIVKKYEDIEDMTDIDEITGTIDVLQRKHELLSKLNSEILDTTTEEEINDEIEETDSVCIEAWSNKNVSSITFLVTVNDTWDSNGCMATVKTPPLQPGKIHHQSQQIQVGTCDHGTLDFTVTEADNAQDKMGVYVTFHSSVINDASPPTCNIGWNGTYLVPTPYGPDPPLLPWCFVMDSREGYHMTYYWFYLLEWTFK